MQGPESKPLRINPCTTIPESAIPVLRQNPSDRLRIENWPCFNTVNQHNAGPCQRLNTSRRDGAGDWRSG